MQFETSTTVFVTVDYLGVLERRSNAKAKRNPGKNVRPVALSTHAADGKSQNKQQKRAYVCKNFQLTRDRRVECGEPQNANRTSHGNW